MISRIRIVSREGGGKEDPGIVSDFVGQLPAVGELGSLGGGLVAHDQRNARIAQRVDAGTDRQFGDAVERRQAVFRETEIADRDRSPSRGPQA